MAKETITVQCYPDDSKINKMTAQYGAFGWELIGNQRCREEGAYVVSTFNKLTFSRDKSEPWYGEVASLEKRHKECMDAEPVNFASNPSKGWLFYGICGLVIGIAAWLILGSFTGNFGALFCLIPALVLIGAGAILTTVFAVKYKKYKSAYGLYLRLHRTWKETSEKEAEELRKKAEAIVNAN